MAEPEIARRCSNCGVTIRQSAAFCPQCGQPLSGQRTDLLDADIVKTQPLTSATSQPAPRDDAETAPTIALDKAQTEALRSAARDEELAATLSLDHAQTAALRSDEQSPADESKTTSRTPPVTSNQQRLDPRPSEIRTPPPTRTVFQKNVRGQVQKIRKASSVVLDQAAYDPSLRFLLVAAGFIILFLILLIASKVLG